MIMHRKKMISTKVPGFETFGFIVTQDIALVIKNEIKCRAYCNEPRKYVAIEYSVMQHFASRYSSSYRFDRFFVYKRVT